MCMSSLRLSLQHNRRPPPLPSRPSREKGLNWTFIISEDGHRDGLEVEHMIVSVGSRGRRIFTRQMNDSRVGAGLSVGSRRWVGRAPRHPQPVWHRVHNTRIGLANVAVRLSPGRNLCVWPKASWEGPQASACGLECRRKQL